MVKILTVEDELIIAQDLHFMLEDMGYHVIGNAMDYAQAIEILKTDTPDLIFLDITLRGKLDGIDLAETINRDYLIPFIFTTSHSDSSTMERAKKVRPINYLVKPFRKEQLFTALEVALFNLSSTKTETPPSENSVGEGLIIKDALFVKDKYKYTKLNLADIHWIKADKNYLEIHTSEKREIIRATLSGFLGKLNSPNLFRVHKSYAVNLDFLTSLEPTKVKIGAAEVPLSKNYAEELLKRLNVL